MDGVLIPDPCSEREASFHSGYATDLIILGLITLSDKLVFEITSQGRVLVKAKNMQSIKAPKLPLLDKLCRLFELGLEDEEHVSAALLSDFDCSNRHAKLLSVDSSQFTRVQMIASELLRSRFVDVIFHKCDLSNANFAESKLNRVEIKDCKLTGFQLLRAQTTETVIQNCSAKMLQCFGTHFKQTLFKNCCLARADFRSCKFENVEFQDCDLQEAEFYDAKLTDVYFGGSQLGGIKAHPTDLKGAVIDADQAVALAEHFATLLGIIVRKS